MHRPLTLLLALALAVAACGSDRPVDAADMCIDTNGVGGACNQAGEVVQGNCFESPRCVCVFPEAKWDCCYAGNGYQDPASIRPGDPCCSSGEPRPPRPCYCDGTHHWSCPADLGTTD